MEFLAVALTLSSVIFGLAVFLQKPLKLELTLKTVVPEMQPVPMTREEQEERTVQLGVAAAIQEAMGVFTDEDK